MYVIFFPSFCHRADYEKLKSGNTCAGIISAKMGNGYNRRDMDRYTNIKSHHAYVSFYSRDPFFISQVHLKGLDLHTPVMAPA